MGRTRWHEARINSPWVLALRGASLCSDRRATYVARLAVGNLFADLAAGCCSGRMNAAVRENSCWSLYVDIRVDKDVEVVLLSFAIYCKHWSGRGDLNARPPAPKESDSPGSVRPLS